MLVCMKQHSHVVRTSAPGLMEYYYNTYGILQSICQLFIQHVYCVVCIAVCNTYIIIVFILFYIQLVLTSVYFI